MKGNYCKLYFLYYLKIFDNQGYDGENLGSCNCISKYVGQLHDIGKIAIDQSILLKPGPLTKIELDEIQRHPDVGYKILKSSKETTSIAEYVLYHHERYDGKGYPSGLKGEEIPLLSRIIAVADSFNAMVSDRCYRKPMSVEDAINELIANKGTQFDPEIVDVAVKVLKNSTKGLA